MKIGPTNLQQWIGKPALLATPPLNQIDGRALTQAQFTLLTPQTSASLSGVLAQLHLLPALNATMNQQPATTQALMQSLLSLWTLPMGATQKSPHPDKIADWLSQRPADKLLATLLRQWLVPQSDGEGIKGALRLMAEQRVAESSRPGEWQWVLPFSDPQLPPIRVNARKQGEQGPSAATSSLRWQVRLYLPVGSQFIRADIDLSESDRELTLTAPTTSLQKRIHQTIDWLNERLANQAIALNITISDKIDDTAPNTTNVSSGTSISVRV
ncbi:hypothetical protein [Salinivibrio sp. ES.052]|uniref:hypothetical protein n=1 Tax=Salinivibrio sp. ES.052 TaxID=1882823 RepID=UPI00092B02AB|nr:hypothetical protein [Salinivibrio sp. ES.052]SIN75958.1 hypothetical protein SAMN05444724_0279 [Salinivibrio sp. ES.052]